MANYGEILATAMHAWVFSDICAEPDTEQAEQDLADAEAQVAALFRVPGELWAEQGASALVVEPGVLMVNNKLYNTADTECLYGLLDAMGLGHLMEG